ncbi:serine hydrolase [Actinacidiphila yeochonensis]|uniref:serine hydrolase n=1 Tax=Actinacidiphila yeochonensis TaxID=89050 RepID=UPI0012FE88D4|nr:serine hydrolase [Actinacidiphila yeochonensis]
MTQEHPSPEGGVGGGRADVRQEDGHGGGSTGKIPGQVARRGPKAGEEPGPDAPQGSDEPGDSHRSDGSKGSDDSENSEDSDVLIADGPQHAEATPAPAGSSTDEAAPGDPDTSAQEAPEPPELREAPAADPDGETAPDGVNGAAGADENPSDGDGPDGPDQDGSEPASAEEAGKAGGAGAASPDAAEDGGAGAADDTDSPPAAEPPTEPAADMPLGAPAERLPRHWWSRPAVLSATALTAMAVITLVAVVRSPSATAGSSTQAERATGSTPTTSAPGDTPGTTPGATSTTTAPTAAPSSPQATTAAGDAASAALSPADAVAQAVRASGVTGRLSVAVVDADGGSTATWNSSSDTSYDTASIVKADILAALLLRDQHQGTQMTSAQRSSAVKMIENSDNDAALALWQTIGRASGLATANSELGLHHTKGGEGDLWGLTQTTASDQIALLRAVFDDGSPLTAASRSYLSGLMRSVTDGQDWGVPAADSDGSGYAVKNGWLPRSATGLWDINSIGEVERDGHRLLVSVLSDGQKTEQGGIDQVARIAKAAAQAYVESEG